MAIRKSDTSVPYLNELIKLSNKDKLAIIAGLSASMIDDDKESEKKEWTSAMTLEQFRAEAKARLHKIYG